MAVSFADVLFGLAASALAVVAAVIAWRQRARARQALAEVAKLTDAHRDAAAHLQQAETAARDRDRAQAATAAKSRFLATISHEIRTPLGGVLGVADLLAGTVLTREQKSYVAAVKTSGEALLTLVDDILDFSRIEAGHLALSPVPFEPVALVEGVVELLAPGAHGKGLEIASFVGADVPARLIGDPHRLRQVLLNLAGNAVKFTERGGVGVAINRCADGRILLSVSDTGPGVPADKRAIIFDEFEQGDDTATGRGEGAGLGLAIVRRIVTQMGGELGVGARAGGGALFAVRVGLPAADAPPDAVRFDNRTCAGRRALIVSGETFQAAYLAGTLQNFGGEAVRVTSSVEAVAILQKPGASFDTLFVDCAGGDEDARAVAAVGRLAGVTKTVLLFSPFERHTLRQPFTAGFDEWLVKPIRRMSLAERFGALAPADPREARAPAGVAPKPARTRVLLAEDNPINALIARTSLERLGAEVVHVTDGESALRSAESALAAGGRPFDLALMDVNMPLLDGLEVTRRIRLAEHAWSHPPMRIVATTAHAFAETRLDCESAGMDEVLTKPIDFAHLRRLVSLTAATLANAS